MQANDEKYIIEHMQRIINVEPCKDNALLMYTYNDNKKEDDYYNPEAVNIGDYIQSLAARQFLENIDLYIDRDQLMLYQDKPVNLIMNSWYYIWRKNKLFSEKINPLFISVHISNPESITQETLNFYKKHEPIGCRDYATRDFLLKNDIKSYFSGCLTLSLGLTYKKNNIKRKNNIYFVDYEMGNKKNYKIDEYLASILKSYKTCSVFKTSHIYPLSQNYLGFLHEAENIIKRYAEAKLVITTRIHCALPCLALGTPVILVVPNYDSMRFSGLINLLNHVGYDENNKFITVINKNKDNQIFNSNDYMKYTNLLKEMCFSFLRINTLNNKKTKKVKFIYYLHQNIIKSLFSKLYKKFKYGNRRLIIVLGFIEISYIKR